METQQTTTQPKKQLTTVALCAKEIRKDLKKFFPTIKFKVVSDNFSMGDSVNVSWTDGFTEDEVKKVIGKYKYGHFDGMIDLYEYSNVIDEIPQTKYLQLNRDLSPETIREFAKGYQKEWNLNEPTEDLSRSFEHNGEWVNWYQIAWRELREVNLK